jgi:hypothetical protein
MITALPQEGCCGNCAWLAKSIKPGGSSPQPMYAVYDETEEHFRKHPSGDFFFVPVFYNAVMPGQLTCFRRVANLPKEVDEQGEKSGSPGAPSWSVVIWSDRRCPKWSQYEPGVAPREHFAEERARNFTFQIKSIESRLTWAAIIFGAIIGIAQIVAAALAVTPDALGCQLVKNVGGLFGALSWLTCK